MWYCDMCEIDVNINTKSSHNKSETHIGKTRKQRSFLERTKILLIAYTYNEPNFPEIDNEIEKAFVGCQPFFSTDSRKM